MFRKDFEGSLNTKIVAMKTRIRNLFLLPALIASLGLIPAGRVTAQTFTTLHNFTASGAGSNPQAGLVLSGNTLYGTAPIGGSGGMIFAINTDGTGFTNVYSFTGGANGGSPMAGLILSGNTLYGTAQYGGILNRGIVFAVNTNGTGFTNLHSFTSGSDANPSAGLILSGNTLYGTTLGDFPNGGSGNGTVFKVNTDGTGFTNLHTFTFNDGINPRAGLILSGNTLYGTATDGTSSGGGTVFAVNTNGTVFTILHSFTGSDGYNPLAGVIILSNTLYGTTVGDGSSGNGTVFAVNTDGTGFTNLHSFTYTDGRYPYAGLILSGNTLYGTAHEGGSSGNGGNGTVFAVKTDGTGFTNLHSFTATPVSPFTNSDGRLPAAGLIFSGNTLYGTAYQGGSSGVGTVFSLSLPLPPQLTITRSAANIILTWPTNAAGFTLQSTTNFVSPIWVTVSPTPVVINGQNTVTNAPSGTKQFYRLSQ